MTIPSPLANAGDMQNTILFAASAAALLSLSACSNEPEVVDTSVDPQAEALANAAPVEAPPMIQASNTYRCKDNSLVYIDFYTNNTARVRAEKGEQGTLLTAPGPDQPYTAEGYSVSGSGKQISYSAPGKGSLTCNA